MKTQMLLAAVVASAGLALVPSSAQAHTRFSRHDGPRSRHAEVYRYHGSYPDYRPIYYYDDYGYRPYYRSTWWDYDDAYPRYYGRVHVRVPHVYLHFHGSRRCYRHHRW
jgi:hypothetical protein